LFIFYTIFNNNNISHTIFSIEYNNISNTLLDYILLYNTTTAVAYAHGARCYFFKHTYLLSNIRYHFKWGNRLSNCSRNIINLVILCVHKKIYSTRRIILYGFRGHKTSAHYAITVAQFAPAACLYGQL